MGVILGGITSILFIPFRYPYLAVLALYLMFLLFTGLRSGSVKMFFPVMWVTFLSQVVYGVGFIKGLVFGKPTKETFNPAESSKVKKQETE